MPRPPDNYTHSQFEAVESDHQGETVQCVHCRNWTGSVKTLNRKKAHLLNCPQYAQWRAAGNGQDLAPPNKYQKRDSSTLDAWDRGEAGAPNPNLHSSPYAPNASDAAAAASASASAIALPTMVRGRNADISKFFAEFWDDSSVQKCMRVRCLSCGFVRAKNTTRQVEHLAQCQPFLSSSEGQAALANGDLEMAPAGGRPSYSASGDIWRGAAPNPNLHVTPSNRSQSTILPVSSRMPPPPTPPRPSPSLVAHLINRWPDKLTKATQQQFLSHAGCGTLSVGALSHWLGQNSHISRSMITFTGCLMGKVRLPETPNSKVNTQYRALDLLISTVSNLRKEIDFIENTKRKYGLHSDGEPPSPLTKAYMDLLASASDSRSTLLEGMVALWATEHCYCVSWQYASNFASTIPSSNYSVPSYLTGAQMDTYGSVPVSVRPVNGSVQHVAALQEALIPNWTSREFSKFVDACRAIVDELANAETSGSGREQLLRCESQYQQVVYLWERLWPEVDGMGQEPDLQEAQRESVSQDPTGSSNDLAATSQTNGNNSTTKADPVEAEDEEEQNGRDADADDDDDDDDDDGDGDADGDGDGEVDVDGDGEMDGVDSPYGGTGLGAIAAANQVTQ